MTAMHLVAVIGTVFIALTIWCAILVLTVKSARLKNTTRISLGFMTLGTATFYKLAALASFTVLPMATIGASSYKLFEGTHETEACASCHVMQPMVTDLHSSTSTTLAALHSRNGWISDNECYSCHSGYGFAGSMAAKMEGYRHLVRYTTGVYEEPIASRTVFDQSSCLNCHEGTDKFLAVNSHMIAFEELKSNKMSCMNCHGLAHPTRKDRTPGSARYDELMFGSNHK